MDPKWDPIWKPKAAKIDQTYKSECILKNSSKKLAKMMPPWMPSTPKTKDSAKERLQFCTFAASCKKYQTYSKINPKIPSKSIQIWFGGLLKAMPKISTKSITRKNHKNTFCEPKLPKITSQNGLHFLSFWGPLCYLLPKCFRDTLRPPQKQNMCPKNMNFNDF